MPHTHSAASAAARHQRALDRHYLVRRPPGFRHVLIPENVAPAIKIMTQAVATHLNLDIQTGRHHHHLATAAHTAAAAKVVSNDTFKEIMELNKRAGKAKHNISKVRWADLAEESSPSSGWPQHVADHGSEHPDSDVLEVLPGSPIIRPAHLEDLVENVVKKSMDRLGGEINDHLKSLRSHLEEARQERKRDEERFHATISALEVRVGNLDPRCAVQSVTARPLRRTHKTKLCSFFGTGSCLKEGTCNFAHGDGELRLPIPPSSQIVTQGICDALASAFDTAADKIKDSLEKSLSHLVAEQEPSSGAEPSPGYSTSSTTFGGGYSASSTTFGGGTSNGASEIDRDQGIIGARLGLPLQRLPHASTEHHMEDGSNGLESSLPTAGSQVVKTDVCGHISGMSKSRSRSTTLSTDVDSTFSDFSTHEDRPIRPAPGGAYDLSSIPPPEQYQQDLFNARRCTRCFSCELTSFISEPANGVEDEDADEEEAPMTCFTCLSCNHRWKSESTLRRSDSQELVL